MFKRCFSMFIVVLAILHLSAYAKFDDSYIFDNELTALETVINLGIIAGSQENGVLLINKDKNVTRAEFVTMMYKLLHSGNAISGNFYNPTFSDIPSWAKQYIGWAQTSGLTVGVGNNKFGGYDTISYFAALRMILSALGVDADYEQFNGSNWKTKTIAIASDLQINLIRQFKPANLNALTRGEVAELLYYSLYSSMIDYDNQRRIVKNKTLGQTYFNLSELQGVIIANKYIALEGNLAGLNKAIIKTPDGKLIEIPLEQSFEFLGKRVNVMLGKNNVYSTSLCSNYVESAFIDSVSTIPNWNISQTCKVIVNGRISNVASKSQLWDEILGEYYITGISNDDDKVIDYIFANNYMYAQVNFVSENYFSLIDYTGEYITDFKNRSIDDIVSGVENIVKDNNVLLTKVAENKFQLLKTDTIDTKASTVAENTVTLNGEQYSMAGNNLVINSNTNEVNKSALLNETLEYVVFKSKIMYVNTKLASEKHYGVVLGSSFQIYLAFEKIAKILMVNEQGDSQIYNVSKVNGSQVSENNTKIKGLTADGTTSSYQLISYIINDEQLEIFTDSSILSNNIANNKVDGKYILEDTIFFHVYPDGSGVDVKKGNHNYLANIDLPSNNSLIANSKVLASNDSASAVMLKYTSGSKPKFQQNVIGLIVNDYGLMSYQGEICKKIGVITGNGYSILYLPYKSSATENQILHGTVENGKVSKTHESQTVQIVASETQLPQNSFIKGHIYSKTNTFIELTAGISIPKSVVTLVDKNMKIWIIDKNKSVTQGSSIDLIKTQVSKITDSNFSTIIHTNELGKIDAVYFYEATQIA